MAYVGIYFVAVVLSVISGVFCQEEFIINGQDADIDDYQYQGSLRTLSDTHSCGCVLVADVWALTAGHCVRGSDYITRWGSTNRNSGQKIEVVNIQLHPEFDDGLGYLPNDIAVLLLASSPNENRSQPIELASRRIDSAPVANLTGWGITGVGEGLSDTLQALTIPVMRDEQCASAWGNNYIPELHMCTYGDGGICQGDTGGALAVDGELQGLASWADPNCNTALPSTYTRVSYYRRWVCSVTNNAAEGCRVS